MARRLVESRNANAIMVSIPSTPTRRCMRWGLLWRTEARRHEFKSKINNARLKKQAAATNSKTTSTAPIAQTRDGRYKGEAPAPMILRTSGVAGGALVPISKLAGRRRLAGGGR